MADLSDDQLAFLRGQLGASADEDDLYDRYDRLGNVLAVAIEVLGERLGDLLQAGSSFTLPGVYSESNDAVIRALQSRIDGLKAQLAAETAAATATSPLTQAKVVRSDRVR